MLHKPTNEVDFTWSTALKVCSSRKVVSTLHVPLSSDSLFKLQALCSTRPVRLPNEQTRGQPTNSACSPCVKQAFILNHRLLHRRTIETKWGATLLTNTFHVNYLYGEPPFHSHICNRETARCRLLRPASTLGTALWALPDPVAHVASYRRTHFGVQTSYKSPFTAYRPERCAVRATHVVL